MKPEVNFYQVDDKIVSSLAPLLLKILEEKKKVLVFCKDKEKIKLLDDSLWSYGRNKFIPHVTIFDEGYDLKRQPILISNEEKSDNKADYLIFLNGVSKEFLGNFERAFCFFEESNFSRVKKLAKDLEEAASKINSYKRDDAKWVKLDL